MPEEDLTGFREDRGVRDLAAQRVYGREFPGWCFRQFGRAAFGDVFAKGGEGVFEEIQRVGLIVGKAGHGGLVVDTTRQPLPSAP